jgi:phosphate transport system substrate-binding protein
MKKIKLLISVLACVFLTVALTACFKPKKIGIPDPLAGDNINQFIVKSGDWQQIVQNKNLFVLGEADVNPYRTDKSGNIVYNFYKHSYVTFPCIDGSTVLIPMAAEFLWQFSQSDNPLGFSGDRLSKTAADFINFSTTATAYKKLVLGLAKESRIWSGNIGDDKQSYYDFEKVPDVLLMTHPSADELKVAEDIGIGLTIEPICYDSFVFITHKNNPVDSLTVEQIQKIYSGKIRNWLEVGGDDREIIAYQREPDSGSQTAMEEMVMKNIPMAQAPLAHTIIGMGNLIDGVAGYENNAASLGYTFKYYSDRLYKNPDVKILKVDGVMPSDENVRNNAYAFVAPYNAVIRAADAENTGGKFLNWILSDEGQACVAQAGYVSVRELSKR